MHGTNLLQTATGTALTLLPSSISSHHPVPHTHTSRGQVTCRQVAYRYRLQTAPQANGWKQPSDLASESFFYINQSQLKLSREGVTRAEHFNNLHLCYGWCCVCESPTPQLLLSLSQQDRWFLLSVLSLTHCLPVGN